MSSKNHSAGKGMYPFRSLPTRQDALCLALEYVHEFGMTNTELSRQYAMCRRTLGKITRGDVVTYNRQWYCDTLITALNDCRLRALNCNDTSLADSITNAIFEVCLVTAKVATDSEIKANSKR